MKIRLSLVALSVLAFAAIAPAQTATAGPTPSTLAAALDKLGGTFVYDPGAKRPILALSWETSRLTGVLGSKVDLSLSALVGAGEGGLALGYAALYTRDIKLTLSNELRGVVSLTAGPALLYGSDGGKVHLGGVAGIAFKF